MFPIQFIVRLAASGLLALSLSVTAVTAQTDPLPSWNDGAAKQAILDFVTRTTAEGSADFVPPEDRIAAFDQDGTLWVEHPIYTEFRFVIDRAPDLVKAHPELADKPAFAAILSKDEKRIAALDARELFEALVVTLSGMTPDALGEEINAWLKTARDPRWRRPYIDLTYLPMQEVLTFLRANGYKTFIATGGSVGVVAPYSREFYGIPPEQVSGSAQDLKFEIVDGKPVLIREAKLSLDNIEAGKIENFRMVYGRTPYAQFGNSSSDDQQALQYVKNSPGLRLSVAILHDDAAREYAYGPAQGLPDSPVGTFSQEMYDLGQKEGWIIVSMKNDWKRIFAFED
ncbi:haloacid dehalogenase-like hydrolase [Hoeflea sp. WL0058]|uniref:Haloacid dehalogenase-like hydrolase n=1 Tax=Flavimaribacter sediminis TaxID=2865987 RepID=A0AAE2ZI08_9HYPH|nr:HAD family hydrolase [Flavimaribacter sediminis]MBW8636873.1 haloacid dehalogenase-like hydrolase [Flavimaribacter sediminis]